MQKCAGQTNQSINSSHAKALSQQVPQLDANACSSGLPAPVHQCPDQAVQAHTELHHPVSVRGLSWSPPASSIWIKMVNGLGQMIRWKVQQMSKLA